jgi:hypothetical protein
LDPKTKDNYEWFQKHENSSHCECIAKSPINQQKRIELNKHSSFSNPLAQFQNFPHYQKLHDRWNLVFPKAFNS